MNEQSTQARRGAPSAEVAAEGRGTRIAAGDEAPPVSIVIPTHNRSDWLRGAMDSVLAQDYPNLELFVVDDGSGDETPALLEHYAGRHPEERFRFLRQANAGQARALNRGNERARGEILGYLSDDDLLAPGAVSRLAGELIADAKAAVAYPGYRIIDEGGVVEDVVRPIEFSPVEALRLHDTIIGPGGLARRWALEAAGGWDPALRFMGDLILWMGVGLSGRAIRVPDSLASWRRHSGSATVRLGIEHAREHLKIVERGISLPHLPSLASSDRAEALRNACLSASLFGGGRDTWPGDRFAMFDLQRKSISAASGGQDPHGEIDWDEAERSGNLYRELVLITVRLAKLRSRPLGPGIEFSGIGGAMSRLQAVGAVPEEDGSIREDVGERELRLGLLEAALACGAETDLRRSRFILIDRTQLAVPDGELEELLSLGFTGSAEQIKCAVEERT